MVRQVEESTDLAFDPDVRVADGDVAATGPGWTMRAVHTPGHTSNHTCFALRGAGGAVPGRPRDGVEHDGRVAARRRHGAPTSSRCARSPGGPGIARTGRPTDRRSPQPQRYVEALVDHRLERERPGARAPCAAGSPTSRRWSPCCTPTSARSCTSRRPPGPSSPTSTTLSCAPARRPRHLVPLRTHLTPSECLRPSEGFLRGFPAPRHSDGANTRMERRDVVEEGGEHGEGRLRG